ncbi:MAG: hypothetical protein CMJ16_04435 [Peredibacter sp.]|nr:hypothetical protein [Peredibacter sp.]
MVPGYYSKLVLVFSLFIVGCYKKGSVDEAIKSVEQASLIKEYDNPSLFVGEAYCYYVYQSVLDPVKIPPQKFGEFVKGGTLSLKFITGYNQWISSKKGELCKLVVGQDFKPIDLDENKKYVIFLNKSAIHNDGQDIKITQNHEKLHVAFSLFKNKRDRISKIWSSMPIKEKNEFKESHPGYNFSNEEVVLREFFAYKFQGQFNKGIQFLID